ncbi:MAG: 3-dehydroquinate synthase [Nitrospinota bacterium]
MKCLKVELGPRSYPIFIGGGLIKNAGKFLRETTRAGAVAVVTNTKVNRLYGAQCASSLRKSGFRTVTITLPDGEKYKTLDYVKNIYDELIKNRFDRADTILALGGGVTGDMAGFAAATYMRGISCVQLPTTLLAQVDSSVGGKTGVDYPGGKNIIGSFHQPRLVLADISTLMTLSAREFRCGMAEVIKYGIISSVSLFNYLEKSVNMITARNKKALQKIITESCRIKAKIVAEDERESGIRAILNMGHTFGHAIETALGFRKLKHGEAVAIGLVMASRLSYTLGILKAEAVTRVSRLVHSFGLPTSPPRNLDPEEVIKGMLHDKKTVSGKHRFIVFDKIGRASIRSDLTKKEIINVLR